jgi:hypothetical protein
MKATASRLISSKGKKAPPLQTFHNFRFQAKRASFD